MPGQRDGDDVGALVMKRCEAQRQGRERQHVDALRSRDTLGCDLYKLVSIIIAWHRGDSFGKHP